MNVKTHVTLLRMQSEYLGQLFTELSGAVKTLGQPLSAQDGNTATDMKAMTERMATVQNLLLTDVEVFCQQVTLFLETYSPQANSSLDTKETEYF